MDENRSAPLTNNKKTLDVEAMIANQFGGTIKDVNPDGTVQIAITGQDGQETTKRFDLPKMMHDQGIDPSKVNIQYNTPENAAEAKDLSFATRLELSLAEDPKSQMKVLANELGEENVKITEQGVVVKERGVWKKADSSFLSDLVASTPEMAGGVAGRSAGVAAGAWAGAGIGALAGPPGIAVGAGIGAAIGAIAGGGLGSALAKVIKDKGVEAVGIKTEYDADKAKEVFGQELATNIAIDTVLGGAGLAWKGLGKPITKIMGKGIGGAIKTVAVGGDKSVTAETLEALVPGTSRKDWLTAMRTPEDATQVISKMNDYHAWAKLSSESSLASPVDPLTKEMTDLAQTAVRDAKQRAMKNYETGIALLDKSGATAGAQVDLTQVAGKFQTTLGDLGILKRDGENGLRVLRRAEAGQSQIMQVFDPKSISTLGKVFDQLNAVLPKGERGIAAPLSFQDTKKMLNGIDDILESSGVYNGGEAAMSNNARRALMSLRRDINETMVKSLPNHKFKMKSGEVLTAQEHYRGVAKRYSEFREAYDDFAMPGAFGGNDHRAAQTVKTMLGEKGMNIEQSFQQMLTLADASPEVVIPRLQQLRAAQNLAPRLSTAKGPMAVLKAKIGLQNPSAIAQTMAESTIKAGKKVIPVSPVSKTSIETMARGVDFFKSLPIDKASQMISNPVIMREFGQTLMNAPVTQMQSQEVLSQQLQEQ